MAAAERGVGGSLCLWEGRGRCHVDESLERCGGDCEGARVPLAEYSVWFLLRHVEEYCPRFLFAVWSGEFLGAACGVGFAFSHCGCTWSVVCADVGLRFALKVRDV